jgi:hypothetical protein
LRSELTCVASDLAKHSAGTATSFAKQPRLPTSIARKAVRRQSLLPLRSRDSLQVGARRQFACGRRDALQDRAETKRHRHGNDIISSAKAQRRPNEGPMKPPGPRYAGSSLIARPKYAAKKRLTGERPARQSRLPFSLPPFPIKTCSSLSIEKRLFGQAFRKPGSSGLMCSFIRSRHARLFAAIDPYSPSPANRQTNPANWDFIAASTNL